MEKIRVFVTVDFKKSWSFNKPQYVFVMCNEHTFRIEINRVK